MYLLPLAAIAATTLSVPQWDTLDDTRAELPAPLTPGPLASGRLAELANALLIDEPGDGRTWARSATWKASFGPEGFTFLPFLGSDVPRNFPVRFDLKEVRVGGGALALSERERSREGKAVTLDRGSVREVYFLADEHVEQTFVLDELPRTGEIVLGLAVDTELVAHPNGDGLLFAGEYGSVSYGAATAFDAAGRSIALEQRLSASGIEIIVPADFAATATLPLVVDPILSSLPITSDVRRQLDLDVAYDGQNSTYQIAISEAQSGIDADVIAVSYNASLDLLFPAVSLDITSASWNEPRNAGAYEAQQFLCVAVVGTSAGSKRIWGRTREATTGARGAQFQISGVGAEHVDVGGKGNDVPTSFDYMVVWQEVDTINQDFDIVAQAVNSVGSLTAGRIVIAGDSDDLDRFPSISKSSGRPGVDNADSEYMVVWERELASNNADIHSQVMHYTGLLGGHPQFRAYSFSESRRPDVSVQDNRHAYGSERYWVIVFERRTGTNFDLFGIVARDGDADNARSIPVMQDYDEGLEHHTPRIGYDSDDYIVGYYTEDPSGPYRVHYTAMNVVHDAGELRLGLAERRQRVGASALPPMVAVASHWDGGGPVTSLEPGDAFVAWLERPTTLTSDVSGAVVAEVEGHVIGSQYCDANVNSTGASAWIKATLFFAPTASDGFNLRCSQLPPNAFGHYLCSLQTGFIANPAGSAGNLCLQGSIGRFNRPGEILNSGPSGVFQFMTVNPTSFPSPTGTVSAVSGESWYFQAWFRDLGPTSNFSNGIEVTFD